MMLTAQRLREVLDLQPGTDVFVWKSPSGRRTKAGDVAGSHGAIGIDGTRYSVYHLLHLWRHGSMPDAGCVSDAPPESRDGEAWAPVAGFETFYLVSNLGRVYSLPRVVAQKSGTARVFSGRILKSKPNGKTGYPEVVLQSAELGVLVWRNVHHLVAEAFLPDRPEGTEVRHKDGSRDNNAASNLEWGAHVDNMHDQYRHGTRIASEWHPLAVLTIEIVQWIRESSQSGAAIARELGVSVSTVCRARKAKTYAALCRSDLAGMAPG